MLTHGNIAANQNLAGYEYNFDSNDAVHLLPASLAHHRPGPRLRDVRQRRAGGLCSQFDKLPQAMREVKPTVFVGVPRVYEKIHQEVERRAGESPVKKRLLKFAIRHRRQASRCGLWRRPALLAPVEAGQQAGVLQGARSVRRTGAASSSPAARRLASTLTQWFASVGIAVWEGYGLTETSPVIALNSLPNHRMGAVGKPLPNIEIKFAEDGELLVRGPTCLCRVLA